MKPQTQDITRLEPGQEIALKSLEGEVRQFRVFCGDAGLSSAQAQYWLKAEAEHTAYLRRLPEHPQLVGRATFGSLEEIASALEEKDYYFG